ncbi:hypothetical protein [Anaerococcus octavius]|nr:hypothetical protein [Anaerococcus octavius]
MEYYNSSFYSNLEVLNHFKNENNMDMNLISYNQKLFEVLDGKVIDITNY